MLCPLTSYTGDATVLNGGDTETFRHLDTFTDVKTSVWQLIKIKSNLRLILTPLSQTHRCLHVHKTSDKDNYKTKK